MGSSTGFIKLKTLHQAGNHLHVLNGGTFNGLDNLGELTLSGNMLIIRKGAFSGLKKLKRLIIKI